MPGLKGVINALLVEKDLTLAVVETFTAGVAAQRLYRTPSSRLLDSRVIPDRPGLARLLGDSAGSVDIEMATTLAQKALETTQLDLALSIVAYPEIDEGNSAVRGHAAVVGLNTRRLALLESA